MRGRKREVTVNSPAATSSTRRGPSSPPRYTVKGPINMREALKALSSQAPSSKLMPTWPFKSARPRLSMRPARVTSPAPVTPPRIPSKGRVDTSDGIAAAAARAISTADGRIVMVEAAIDFWLSSGVNSCYDRKSGTQPGCDRRVVQRNLDGNTLYNLREIARGVVGRQQSELRSAGRRDLDHFATNELSGIFVKAQFGRVPNFHVGQLGFAIVRFDPLGQCNKGDDLGAGGDELPRPNLPFAHRAVVWSVIFGVAEVHLNCHQAGLLGVKIGLKLGLLGFENGFAASLGLGSEFTATQRGLRLIEIGVTAGKLGGEASFGGDSGLEALLGRRVSLIKPFLAFTFRASANQLSLHGCLASLGGCNLCLCLIDAGQCFRDARILQLALAKIFLNAGTRRLNCRFGLIHLRLIVIMLQFDQEIAPMHLLVVRPLDCAHDARHFGTERSKVAANVSIICDLFDLAAFPRIPVARDGDQNGQSEKHHKNGSYIVLPPGALARDRLIRIALRRQWLRDRRSLGHWRGGH